METIKLLGSTFDEFNKGIFTDIIIQKFSSIGFYNFRYIFREQDIFHQTMTSSDALDNMQLYTYIYTK